MENSKQPPEVPEDEPVNRVAQADEADPSSPESPASPPVPSEPVEQTASPAPEKTSKPSKKKKGRGLWFSTSFFALVVSFTAFCGVLAGFFLALAWDPFHVELKSTAFSPGSTVRINKGQEFTGLSEVGDLSRADRKKYRLAMKFVESRNFQEAMPLFEALVLTNMDNPMVAGVAAWLRLQSHPPEIGKANQLLSAALASNPETPFLKYVEGLRLESMHLSDSAESVYRKILEAAPAFAYPFAGLGRIQLDKGDTKHAGENFRKAIALMESYPDLYKAGKQSALPTEIPPFDWLATLYTRIGAQDSARMAVGYGLDKGWRTDRMDLAQGWIWETSGFMPKADSTYRALMERDPDNPEYAHALATMGTKPLADSKARNSGADAGFAISILDPLARQYPGNATLWMALGQSYYRRGLHDKAVEAYDSSLKADPTLPGVEDMRAAAFSLYEEGDIYRNREPEIPPRTSRRNQGRSAEGDEAAVVLPGSIALLGAYNVPWGSTPLEVRKAYPAKKFRTLPNGDLMDEFAYDGAKHQYLLAFRTGRLWGIRVFVTDTSGMAGDIFGRFIRIKSKISGEGKGTGEAECKGFRPFQGVIWENDDTFEFMAQFQTKERQIRMARLGRESLSQNRRLCDLVPYLQEETWAHR